MVEQFEEGDWLASFSIRPETEMRFVLRKVRDVEADRMSSKVTTDSPKLVEGTTSAVLSTVVERKIVIVLHNLMLFDAIRPVVERLGHDVKFLVPRFTDVGFDAMAEFTREKIAATGFEAERVSLPADIRCEIELSPYPYATQNVRHAKWRIRFMYGLAKEAWNFSIDNNVYYDFVLTYGDYDSRVISAYSTPVKVGNPKIIPTTPAIRENGVLPVLLYMPTYGPTSSIEAVSRIQNELKAQYRVIAKVHHGTTYLESERISLLHTWVDELAHHDASVSSLLSKTDVVLSDGSGAIFDAIAARVPIAVFQDKVYGGLSGTVSLEERLTRDALIPAAYDVKEIPRTLARALEAGPASLEVLRSDLFVAFGNEAADRGAAFVSGLLDNPQVYETYAVARQILRTRLHETEFQRAAELIVVKSAWRQRAAIILEEIRRANSYLRRFARII